MTATPRSASDDPPTHVHYDGSLDSTAIVVDVDPADVEDLTVAVGPDTAKISSSHPENEFERSIEPPTDAYVFDDDRDAFYNNGVLTVELETVRRRSP